MVTLQEVQKCLYDNPNLTEAVKENMDFLIQVFHNKLPEVDLTYLSNNLKTLSLETTSKFVSNLPLHYDINRNKLVIVKSELEKDYDAKYLMMVAIIDMMSKRVKCMNNIFSGTVAQTLVGNEGKLIPGSSNEIADSFMGFTSKLDINKMCTDPRYPFNALSDLNVDLGIIESIKKQLDYSINNPKADYSNLLQKLYLLKQTLNTEKLSEVSTKTL